MNDIIIEVQNSTRKLLTNETELDVKYANLQKKLIFKMDTFIDGTGVLEYEIDGVKRFAEMIKIEDGYEIDIKSCLLISNKVKIDLKITENGDTDSVPIFISKTKEFNVPYSIGATEEEPDEYPSWLDEATKLMKEMEFIKTNFDTKQDNLVSGINIKTINDESILGEGNITISGSGETSDYDSLDNKPKINDIDLSGNKTSADLGLQEKLSSGTNIKTINGTSILGSGNLVIESGDGGLSSVAHDDTMTGAGTNASPLKVDTTKIAQKSDIPDTSNFITKSVNDLTNYTKTSDLGGLATKNTVNYETEVTNKPTIPSQVTEATVSGWGFTKNTGTYSKPSSGIPKSDLSSTVQASLNKADSALQEHQSLSNYYTKSEVDSKVSSVYKYKGTVATYSALPSTGLTIGDVYNVESDGSNYAWTGTTWDKLGGDIDLSNYQTKISSSNKLSSDLVDDSNSGNKFVTTSEKNIWNNKSDFSGNYNDLSNKPLIPTVPTNISAFTNDVGYITNFIETDPVFEASPSANITSNDITNWNNKSDFSGNYNDLTNKPNIPSKISDLTNDSDFVVDLNYVHTDNNYTTTEKNKLSNLNNYVLPTASSSALGGIKIRYDSSTSTLYIRNDGSDA